MVGCTGGYYLYDYFFGEKVSDLGKEDQDGTTIAGEKEDADKKEGEEESDWMIYSAVAVMSLLGLIVFFLPAISAVLGLDGYLGVVTGPISAGKEYVSGILGFGQGGLPPPL